MRTDSVNLSETALDAASKMITQEFGDKYLNRRQYKTKSKGAQEAHEAIRPTYFENQTIAGTATEKKLYELIWKRTIASQMSDAALEKTTVTIGISTQKEKFIAVGEVLKFDGFLKVYLESTDDESDDAATGLLPSMVIKQTLESRKIVATERFTHHQPRYTEASLVKKLEELGIGRPSTYAPTITTIISRGYITKEDREGIDRNIRILTLKDKSIVSEKKIEKTGAEKAKLFPSDIGMIVNDFLIAGFNAIMDFNFTATVEKEFDDIAAGKMEWTNMLSSFYAQFHPHVEQALVTTNRNIGERTLGNDPKTDLPVIAKMGKYGPMVQLGIQTDDYKPRFAGLIPGQYLETITLDEALSLLTLPRKVGEYEGFDIVASIGRFGPYVQHHSAFYSLKKNVDDPYTIDLERAIEVIEEKREKDRNKVLRAFDNDKDLQVLNGRWGAYIAYKNENYKIPKTVAVEALDYEQCMKIVNEVKPSISKGKRFSKTTKTSKDTGSKASVKKTTTKATTNKKATKK
jgi:DNA topoisomerase-1